jgi:hypothetical protein
MSWIYYRGRAERWGNNRCAVCSGETTERATYCSATCRQRAHRLRQRAGADPARRAEDLVSLAGELRALAEHYAQLLDRPGLRPVLTLLGKAEATVTGAISEALGTANDDTPRPAQHQGKSARRSRPETTSLDTRTTKRRLRAVVDAIDY